jgi:predicted GH43/DUF377 family glycosyl hydrolase
MRTLSRRHLLTGCGGAAALAALSDAASAQDAPPAQTEVPSWGLGPFTRSADERPVLAPRADTRFLCPVSGRTVAWEEKDVFNPAAVVKDGRVQLIYRAEDTVGRFAGTSRIGLATSADGMRFDRRSNPVLYPQQDAFQQYEWEGGCEDPRVVETGDGRYVMTYTAYDGNTARLCVASSRDLIGWTKHGPAFAAAHGGRFRDRWSKSGAIVCERRGDRLVAVTIGGRYWMYFGDTDLFVATSEDLLAWTPLLRRSAVDARGRLADPVSVMAPRRSRFDSALVEPGPPAILTDDGILLLYNGANSPDEGDAALPPMAYSAGQALFDAKDPSSLIARSRAPFFRVQTVHETTGQVNNVCFIEGLVRFNGRWLLYYGMGDSRIGVAMTRS